MSDKKVEKKQFHAKIELELSEDFQRQADSKFMTKTALLKKWIIENKKEDTQKNE